MSKYVVWKTATEGEYVKADEVRDDGETVTFLLKGKQVRQDKLKDIEGYSEVEQ